MRQGSSRRGRCQPGWPASTLAPCGPRQTASGGRLHIQHGRVGGVTSARCACSSCVPARCRGGSGRQQRSGAKVCSQRSMRWFEASPHRAAPEGQHPPLSTQHHVKRPCLHRAPSAFGTHKRSWPIGLRNPARVRSQVRSMPLGLARRSAGGNGAGPHSRYEVAPAESTPARNSRELCAARQGDPAWRSRPAVCCALSRHPGQAERP
jgi:hypothetical protein